MRDDTSETTLQLKVYTMSQPKLNQNPVLTSTVDGFDTKKECHNNNNNTNNLKHAKQQEQQLLQG